MLQDEDWLVEGIAFMYPIDQAVIFNGKTGKVLGRAQSLGRAAQYSIQSEQYIIQLDQPLEDGTKAVVVHESRMQLLTCHWCNDTQKVADSPFNGGQAEHNNIPIIPCPYCTEKQVTNG